MRIIFEKNGNATVRIPTPKLLARLEGTEEQKLIYIANKTLPTGTKYEIINDEDVPTDRTNRQGWKYVSGPNERIAEDVE